ncbi:MAG: response regulator [Lachnospiraceae bacterium]|nr:response regulator [Lachnospiraceae bacterium]
MKYLVVDDEQLILKDEVRVLESILGDDSEILTADNSSDAIKLAKSEKPYVIFLDINMPGMDGFELSQVIAKDSPDSNIVFVTGQGQRCPEASANKIASSILLKPVTKLEVQDAMMRLRKPRI